MHERHAHFRALLIAGIWVLLVSAGPVQAAPRSQERIPLRYGQTVMSSIDNIQFFQQYSFLGAAGDSVTITMEALSGDLDPLLLLGDSALNLIGEDDDGAGGFDARLEVVLPADGTYIIEATRFGQNSASGQTSGDYRLTLLVDQPVGAMTDQRAGILFGLSYGNTTRGVLSASQRFHLFWFQAQAGDQLQIRTALSTGLNSTLAVYDSDFVELARDSSGQEVAITVEAAGVYFAALALAEGGEGGTYALSLSGNIDADPTELVLPLLYNQTVQGVITNDQPVERYVFEGQANNQVLIRMESQDSELDPYLELHGPGGEIIGQDDDSAGVPDAELAVILPSDGSYVISASRFGREDGRSVGSYVLSLMSPTAGVEGEQGILSDIQAVDIPADFEGLPQVQYGQRLGGGLDDAEYYRAYVFEASAGDQVVAVMETTSGNLDPMLMLLDANLVTVAEHDDISDANKNARLEFTVPEDGFYALLATRYNGETGTTTGDFRLSFTSANVVQYSQAGLLLPAADLPVGDTVNGQLGDQVAQPYRLYAAAGDIIEVDLTVNGPLQEDSLLILCDSALREVAVGYGGTLRYEVLEEGAYILLVTREGGPLSTARGFYAITANGIDPEAAERLGFRAEPEFASGDVIPYGTVISGAIDDARVQEEFRFAGAVGDRIAVQVNAIDATLDPLLMILDPDGEMIVQDDDGGGNLNAFVPAYLLTSEGEYTIVVSRSGGRIGTSRGRYELVLTGVAVTTTEDVESSGDAPGTALAIVLGQTVSGAITDDQVAEFYAFTGSAGSMIQIDMIRIGGDLDPFVALLDETQSMIASDDDSAGNQNARLVYVLPADGSYFIVATRFELTEGVTGGDYLLSLLEREISE